MKIYKNVLYSLNKAQQSVHSNIQEMYQVVNIVVKIKNQITGDKNPPKKMTKIQEMLCLFRYKAREEFKEDVQLVFSNCKKFNEDESPVGRAGSFIQYTSQGNKRNIIFLPSNLFLSFFCILAKIFPFKPQPQNRGWGDI